MSANRDWLNGYFGVFFESVARADRNSARMGPSRPTGMGRSSKAQRYSPAMTSLARSSSELSRTADAASRNSEHGPDRSSSSVRSPPSETISRSENHA